MLHTDASGYGMGALLLQEGHPIYYFSKKICPKLQNASTYVHEFTRYYGCCSKWHHYLLGRNFTTETDQKSLKDLMIQVIQTPD